MLDPQFLKILRCPIDPRRQAALTQPDETKLLCERCAVQFPIRDGFPILLIDLLRRDEHLDASELPGFWPMARRA